MAQVTGTIGTDQVVFDNAATEDTLKQILASMRVLNQSILRQTPSAGGAALNTSQTQQANNNLSALGVASGLASSAFGLLTSVIGSVAAGIGIVAGAFVDLGSKVIDGTAKMSDFYSALQGAISQIPLIGGILGGLVGIFKKIALIQEENLEVYRRLTNVGVNFGGALTSMRESARSTFMTLDNFARMIEENSNTLAKMGGSANSGTLAFTKLANTLQNDPAGKALRSLGYTSDQVNQGMLDYIAITGGRTKSELSNTKNIINGTTGYLEQLDRLADITGKSRAEQEKALKQQMEEADIQQTMAQMTVEDRTAFSAAMNEASAHYGQAGRDIVLAQAQGRAVTGDAGKMLTATAGNTATAIAGFQATAKAYGATGTQFKNLSNAARVDLIDSMKGISPVVHSVNKSLNSIGDASKTASKDQLAGLTSMKAMDAADALRDATIAKRKDSEASAASEAQKSLDSLGQLILSGLSPVIKALTPIVTQLVGQFTEFVKKVPFAQLGADLGKWITQMDLPGLATKFSNFINNLFSPEGRQQIINDLKAGLRFVVSELVSALKDSIFGTNSSPALAAPSLGSNHHGRATGSIGATGKLFENFGNKTQMELHGTESVLTPDQMSQLLTNAMNKGQNNNLTEAVQRLNSISLDILLALKEVADNSKKNVAATKSLSPNLFAR